MHTSLTLQHILVRNIGKKSMCLIAALAPKNNRHHHLKSDSFIKHSFLNNVRCILLSFFVSINADILVAYDDPLEDYKNLRDAAVAFHSLNSACSGHLDTVDDVYFVKFAEFDKFFTESTSIFKNKFYLTSNISLRPHLKHFDNADKMIAECNTRIKKLRDIYSVLSLSYNLSRRADWPVAPTIKQNNW